MSTIAMLTKPVTRLRPVMPTLGAARLLATGVDVRACKGDFSVTGFEGSYSAARIGDVRGWEPDH